MKSADSPNSIGVVVPTLGERPDWLAACLHSLITQDVDNVQIVIVGPDTPALRAIALRFSTDFLARTPAGLSDAINAGFDMLLPRSKYVTWLGDDDLLAPGSLRSVRASLDSAPRATFAYGDTRYIDGAGNAIYLSRPTRFAPMYMRVGKDFVPQPGSLVRSSALPRRPALDPALRNSMDLDLFLYLSRTGKESWAYVRREVSAYRLHADAITAKKGSFDESEAVRKKYYPRGWRYIARPAAAPRRFLERALVWFQWRLCKPAVPQISDLPYTRAHAALTTDK